MLCCLLIGMLLAQVAAFFRRGRAWLGLRPGRAATAVAFVTAQAVALTVVVLHWDHLVHEARSIVAPAALASPPGPICSADTAS